MPNSNDFFTHYLTYVGKTESPDIYHRWCSLSGLGSLLGRRCYVNHGHFVVNPNLYVMLLGRSGVRKSTAIKIWKNLQGLAGYKSFSADKTTKEKFLLDLAGVSGDSDKSNTKSIMDANLWGDEAESILSTEPRECFIVADEWNDFTSLGNMEFYSLLGTLWDWGDTVYENRIKTGISVKINRPTISILGGNTPTNFALAFPPEILGQGFFSRLLLIHSDRVKDKITWPVRPCSVATAELVGMLRHIMSMNHGAITPTHGAKLLLEKIYLNYKGIEDSRFESYCNRRFTQLLKLSLITAVSGHSKHISEPDVILANTILTHAEKLMPDALGEFGKGRNSDVANKVVDILSNTKSPMTLQKLWSFVSQDCDRQSSLVDILANLRAAEKIQAVGSGFMARKKVVDAVVNDTVNYSLLTKEERGEF